MTDPQDPNDAQRPEPPSYGDPTSPSSFESPTPPPAYGTPPAGGEQQPPSFDKPPSFDNPPPPAGGAQPPGAAPPPPSYGFPPAPPAHYQPPPPVGPGGLVFDQAAELYLPPGVQLAGRGRRIGAYFLRYVLIVVTLVIGYLIWGLVLWSRGTSPALKVLGMKCWVISENRPATFWRMALRNIVGEILEGIFILPLVSFIMFLATRKKQSLHDLIGGTTVVHDPNKVLGR